MPKKNVSVFICHSCKAAEKAVNLLRTAGYNVHKLSVIGRDYPDVGDDVAASTLDGKKRSLVEVRSFWCRMWCLLSEDAFLNVEGIGSIIVAGSMTEPVLETWRTPQILEVRNPLRAGMRAVGIARSDLTTYEEALQANCFLVIAQGNPVEAIAAVEILKSCAETEVADEQLLRHSA
jgi:hypothetical protein